MNLEVRLRPRVSIPITLSLRDACVFARSVGGYLELSSETTRTSYQCHDKNELP